MIPLHVESPGSPKPVSFQGQPPCRIANPGAEIIGNGGGTCAHQPARRDGTGLGAAGLAQQESHDAMLASSKGETPACRQIELTGIAADFGHHG
jgi:hypothetical protein